MNKLSKKPSCLSIWNSNWYVLYYAFNGNPKKEMKYDKNKYIKSMYNKSKQVFYSDSYVKYEPIYDYKDDINPTFIKLDSFSFDLSSVGIYKPWALYKPDNPLYQSPMYNRNWSCAEKKILGFLSENYNVKNPTIYTTKYPCKLCLPELRNFVLVDYENNTIVKGRAITKCGEVCVRNKR